jgi:glucokinase
MPWDLVADIGGTNMRLAAGRDGLLAEREKFPTVGGASIGEAIGQFVEAIGSAPARAAVAAAGIVENGSVTLTNTGTVISETIINDAAGIDHARVLNDFEAAAWSLADVSPDNILTLQGSGRLIHKPRLIIGPGTGLGVGALVWQGDQPVVVQGEGGHARLSPDTREELEIFRQVGALWPETRMGDGYAVEAEAILSGTGLPVFYRAIADVEGVPAGNLKAAEIFKACHAGGDLVAEKTAHLFVKYLGEFAGDMAVTFAARGGVFLAGGVIAANPWMFEDATFLNAFNSGGRHTGFRKRLPVYVFNNSDFGLHGALNYLRFGG